MQTSLCRKAAALALICLVFALPALADTTVTIIDVGQGDSIWVHSDPDFDVLIDAGDAAHGPVVLSHLAGLEDLDALVWTHAHADHIGGMGDVLAALPVDYALYNGFDYDSATFNDLWDLLIAYQVPVTSTHTGDVWQWGECTATVLHPDRQYLNTNDNSVVIRLDCGDVSMLLTGDAELEAENAMRYGGIDLTADILKVGHHGSNTSTSGPFLSAVSPAAAVISVGENDYGHPTGVVLNRLADAGVTTYRTDDDGDVTIVTDGSSYQVYTGSSPQVSGEACFLPLMLSQRPPTPAPTPTRTPTVTATPSQTPTPAPSPTVTPAPQADLYISYLREDTSDEYVRIRNGGTGPQLMTGWRLVSVVGNQTYYFPYGYTLGAGETVTVHSGPGAIHNPPSDLRWTTAYIWNNSGDEAELYDDQGRLVDSWGY